MGVGTPKPLAHIRATCICTCVPRILVRFTQLDTATCKLYNGGTTLGHRPSKSFLVPKFSRTLDTGQLILRKFSKFDAVRFLG